ncbi:hypothetical protein [Bacillus haynesii]|uniref:hypothetical protein n=1 Tax=Bacillus haynesii TaxID=1925021 RepID=UPI002280FD84|nr:hypothetical protein [Bacillus haynesii]MCY9370102.1 hypothetical protein [Bacillus haynesii]MEC0722222.1 hypothetical protein [Bacillus haynesii]
MTKRKWIVITAVFFILFIFISFYRYQLVNSEYSNYKVTERNVKLGETFNLQKISHTFKKAKKVNTVDEMRNKVTEYRIPIELKNTSNTKLAFHPEFYRMMRGEEETQTIDFIDNKTGSRISDLKPRQSINATVTFTFLNRGGNKYQPLVLHMIGSDGVSVQKFNVKVY